MSDVFPVLFGICLDAESVWIGRDPANAKRPIQLSHGSFEIREGLGPLLDLLDAHGIRASFFIPGLTADLHPEAIRLIHRRGHELGTHGHGHKPIPGLSPEEERSELVKGIDSLEKVIGVRSPLWRSPSWEWSDLTLDMLIENGITMSTNFHDRVRPYRHERGGEPTPVVELPVQWHLADAPFFNYGGQVGRVISPAVDVQRIWEEEFDGLYEWPGAFYHLTLHVQLIGHPGRLKMLDRHIRFIREHGRARFMTCAEIAETVA